MPPTDRIRVPLPGGPLTATADDLRTLAAHIRRELRRQVVPHAPAPAYQIWLPTGRRLVGSAAVLDRLADRLDRAAAGVPSGDRARLAGVGGPIPAPPLPPGPPTQRLTALDEERVTQALPDLLTNLDSAGDPTDPDAPPGAGWYQYFGCVWAPDYTTTGRGVLAALQRRRASPAQRAMEGWYAATPEVEVWGATILLAACRQAVDEAVELADDEVLAVRWAGSAAPTCWFDPARVQLAQWCAAHPGAGLPPEPHRGYFRLHRHKPPTG